MERGLSMSFAKMVLGVIKQQVKTKTIFAAEN